MYNFSLHFYNDSFYYNVMQEPILYHSKLKYSFLYNDRD